MCVSVVCVRARTQTLLEVTLSITVLAPLLKGNVIKIFKKITISVIFKRPRHGLIPLLELLLWCGKGHKVRNVYLVVFLEAYHFVLSA